MPAPASAPPAVPRWAAALCLAGAATLTWAQSPPPSAVALPPTSLPPLAAFGILFGVLVALPVSAFLIAWLRGAGRGKS